MPAILEFFPEVALELNKEVQNHPLLLSELSRLQQLNGDLDLRMTIGVVAAYCDVILDGSYFEEDIEILFHMLLKRLKKINEIIVH